MPPAKAERRAALLIDCDNQSHEHLDFILKEAAKEGDVLIQRAYGNWASPHLAGWRKACEARGVRTMQTPTHVTGKNTSDIALVIEAMDIFHQKEADVFCIVTSDSDFAQLAIRLREGGKRITGIVAKGWEDKPFASSCNHVLTVPVKTAVSAKPAAKSAKRKATAASAPKPASGNATPQPTSSRSPKAKPDWVPRVVEIVRRLSADGQCPLLSTLGKTLKESTPPINYKDLKFKRLTDMFESESDTFQVQKSAGGSATRVCLKANTRERQ